MIFSVQLIMIPSSWKKIRAVLTELMT